MPTAEATLARRLSLPLLVFYGIGTILGAGIYVLVGKVAGEAGMHAPLAFVVAACLAAFSAFSYAELAARFPRSAGEAVYVQEGLGYQPLSILVGLMIVAVSVVSVATLVHGFVGYLNLFVTLPASIVIICVMLLLGVVVAWGIEQSVMVAALMTIAEVLGLLIILWVGRQGFTQLPAHLPEIFPSFSIPAWSGILMGAFIAFYAYIGFEDIVNVAEEAINPSRNLPLAVVISLIVTTIFYILIALVSVTVMPLEMLANSEAPLAHLYQAVTHTEPVVITIISLVSVLNGALIQIIMASRMLYGLGSQRWISNYFSYVHPVTRTPVISIAVVTGLIITFALLLPLLSLAKLTSFITLSIFVLINLALLRIKLRATYVHRGFQVPLVVPLSGFIFSLLFVGYQLVHVLES